MWTSLLLVACTSPDPVLPAQVAVSASSPVGPVVTYADGTQLWNPVVSATGEPGGQLAVSVEVAPRMTAESLSWEASLWQAGGDQAAIWTGTVPPWPGERVHLQLETDLPDDLAAGSYWLQLRLRVAGDVLQAEPFRNGRVSLGVVQVGVAASSPHPPVPAEGPVLAVSGDVSIARRMHTIVSHTNPRAPLAAGVEALANADLAYVNLECAVGVGGEQGVAKGERTPFYYRARPEMLGVLTSAGVDVVGLANNHAGDYGTDVLAKAPSLLASVGISATGAGPDARRACAPVYRKAGDLTVAFIALDTTMPHFAASQAPGTCYADVEDQRGLLERLRPSITEARSQADLVFVGVHWGMNRKPRPTRAARRVGRALIAAGADAVLGSSAHSLQGIELVDGRPILYDTGNLLFDSRDLGETTRGGLFELHLSPDGVRRITVTPLDVAYGRTSVAEETSAARTLMRLRDLSTELGTQARFDGERMIVDLPPLPRRPRPQSPATPNPTGDARPTPATEPPPGCRVDTVPDDAVLPPEERSGLVLLGARLETQTLDERRGVWLETWWRLGEGAPARDRVLQTRVQHETPHPDTLWNADHEPCDWGWPSSRWAPDGIYRDRYLLRPRPTFPDGRYEVTVQGVAIGHIDVDTP